MTTLITEKASIKIEAFSVSIPKDLVRSLEQIF